MLGLFPTGGWERVGYLIAAGGTLGVTLIFLVFGILFLKGRRRFRAVPMIAALISAIAHIASAALPWSSAAGPIIRLEILTPPIFLCVALFVLLRGVPSRGRLIAGSVCGIAYLMAALPVVWLLASFISSHLR
jgi:hypothetical protein